ncbi:NAD(P)H-dependent flavin oxidoreductase [Carboxylicivirga sp. N1Y90]|uniref:NAD(P)H-dependent flavin oxidoreductase n=1 Tax=Carboxylicivirga fragile TaxID=3417571 RepID=UPI003D348C3C|nr:nitronate monooxygenase [Marinilabiliaceae bacterium N1Y90]
MNRVTELFNIKYPIVQGGMVWCSGWKLASAVSNNGGLGLLGAGSMRPEILREHIQKMQKATDKPWGVNVPLLYPDIDQLIQILIEEKVKIVFTSAGNPAKWTGLLKENGMTVVHVIANGRFTKKCEDAGVDAIVAEGFEAGGHNGREETTTLTLIQHIRQLTSLPLIAAGGIGTGKGMLTAMTLGADGVQIGSLFAASEESSAHSEFKKCIIETGEGGTQLSLKKLAPVRLIKNAFFEQVQKAELEGASALDLQKLLGKGRAKKGIFEGDMIEGELEIGQIATLINEVKPVKEQMTELLKEYNEAKQEIANNTRFQF